MKEILVAIDGSEHSNKVVDYASELAENLSAKIVLLYVVPEVHVPEEYRTFAGLEKVDPDSYFAKVGEQVLDKLAKTIAKNVPHEEISVVGHPGLKIDEIASLRKVSLIVVGLHGLHGLGRLRTLGSTARRVIEKSEVPVLVVP
jgi:nucleotide-binding universal stress UspA family protein